MGHQGRRKAPSTHSPPPRPLRNGSPPPYDDGGGWATATRGDLVGVGGSMGWVERGLAPTLVAHQLPENEGEMKTTAK